MRILTASHRNLQEMVREGTFREDLFYRVAVLSLDLPALRERRDDIPILAEHLLLRAAREAGPRGAGPPHDVMTTLCAHDWPGNVRELENEMRRLLVLSGGGEHRAPLRGGARGPRPHAPVPRGAAQLVEAGDIQTAVADLERRSIEAALAQAGGNKSRAAEALGISRFALQRKLDKYGIGKTRRRSSAAEGLHRGRGRAAVLRLDREPGLPQPRVAPRGGGPRRRVQPGRGAGRGARAVRGGAVLHRARGAGR